MSSGSISISDPMYEMFQGLLTDEDVDGKISLAHFRAMAKSFCLNVDIDGYFEELAILNGESKAPERITFDEFREFIYDLNNNTTSSNELMSVNSPQVSLQKRQMSLYRPGGKGGMRRGSHTWYGGGHNNNTPRHNHEASALHEEQQQHFKKGGKGAVEYSSSPSHQVEETSGGGGRATPGLGSASSEEEDEEDGDVVSNSDEEDNQALQHHQLPRVYSSSPHFPTRGASEDDMMFGNFSFDSNPSSPLSQPSILFPPHGGGDGQPPAVGHRQKGKKQGGEKQSKVLRMVDGITERLNQLNFEEHGGCVEAAEEALHQQILKMDLARRNQQLLRENPKRDPTNLPSSTSNKIKKKKAQQQHLEEELTTKQLSLSASLRTKGGGEEGFQIPVSAVIMNEVFPKKIRTGCFQPEEVLSMIQIKEKDDKTKYAWKQAQRNPSTSVAFAGQISLPRVAITSLAGDSGSQKRSTERSQKKAREGEEEQFQGFLQRQSQYATAYAQNRQLPEWKLNFKKSLNDNLPRVKNPFKSKVKATKLTTLAKTPTFALDPDDRYMIQHQYKTSVPPIQSGSRGFVSPVQDMARQALALLKGGGGHRTVAPTAELIMAHQETQQGKLVVNSPSWKAVPRIDPAALLEGKR